MPTRDAEIDPPRAAESDGYPDVVALQDHALQTFFAIGLVAQAALAELAPRRVSEPVAAALVQMAELATQGTEHLREAIFVLNHIAQPASVGAVPALWRLVRRFQERTGIEADLVVTGAWLRLPKEIEELVQAVSREALVNVERHAQASAVVLGLHVARHTLTLSVHDDGAGAPEPAGKRIADSASRFALRGIGPRVRQLGGTLVAHRVGDSGFRVRMRLPFKTTV